jgi:hypothetical protein
MKPSTKGAQAPVGAPARKKLEGLKEIAFFLAELCEQSVSTSAVSRLAVRPINPLPVHWNFSGRIHAFDDDLRRWAKNANRPHRRRDRW